MTILVCGPERSGGTAVSDFLRAAGLDTVHKSYPHGGVWPRPAQYTQVVAVTRHMPDVIESQTRLRASVYGRWSYQPNEWAARSHIGLARRLIVEQYADQPGYTEVTYEALAADRARHDLAVLLGATDVQATEAVGSFEWRPCGVLAEAVIS